MSLRGWPAEREPFLQMHSFLPKCLTKKCKAKKDSQLYTESFNARNTIAANCAKQLKIDTTKMMSMADLPPQFNTCYDEAARKSPVNTYLAQQIACGQKMKCLKKSILKRMNKMKKKGGAKNRQTLKKKINSYMRTRKQKHHRGGNEEQDRYQEIADNFAEFSFNKSSKRMQFVLPHELVPGYVYKKINCRDFHDSSDRNLSLHMKRRTCEISDDNNFNQEKETLTFMGVFLQEKYGNPERSNRDKLEKTYNDPTTTYNVDKLFFQKDDGSYICYNSNKMNRFVFVKSHHGDTIQPMFVAVIRGEVEEGHMKKVISNANYNLNKELEKDKNIYSQNTFSYSNEYLIGSINNNSKLINEIFISKIKCEADDLVCAPWYNNPNSNSTEEFEPPNKKVKNPDYGADNRNNWLYY